MTLTALYYKCIINGISKYDMQPRANHMFYDGGFMHIKLRKRASVDSPIPSNTYLFIGIYNQKYASN